MQYISSPVDAIRSGIDVLVGTPGRIKDHLQNNKLDLSQLKHVVLDEVDQMLDMGFAEQVEEILSASYKKGEPFSTQGKNKHLKLFIILRAAQKLWCRCQQWLELWKTVKKKKKKKQGLTKIVVACLERTLTLLWHNFKIW